MPIIEVVQSRLRKAFPQSADEPLARASREGVLLADDLFGEGTFLNNSLGHDLRGFVRRVGISHQIHTYCQRGDLPFSTEMCAMPKGRWHWLEISAPGVCAHVCRTHDVFTFPDEAESRQDLRLSIQPNLLTWSTKNKSIAETVEEIPEIYAWLIYRVSGDGSLAHLCWASPAPDADEWIAHINILREIARAGAATPLSVSTPDPKERLRFKDHVRQALDQSKSDKASNE